MALFHVGGALCIPEKFYSQNPEKFYSQNPYSGSEAEEGSSLMGRNSLVMEMEIWVVLLCVQGHIFHESLDCMPHNCVCRGAHPKSPSHPKMHSRSMLSSCVHSISAKHCLLVLPPSQGCTIWYNVLIQMQAPLGPGLLLLHQFLKCLLPSTEVIGEQHSQRCGS